MVKRTKLQTNKQKYYNIYLNLGLILNTDSMLDPLLLQLANI